jgi:hypothetical protein
LYSAEDKEFYGIGTVEGFQGVKGLWKKLNEGEEI